MAVIEELGLLPYVERRVRSGAKQKTIVEELRALFPGVRGISVRSVKRFCSNHGLHRTMRLNDRALDVIVAFGIGTVGPSYGRKMMTGFLASQGFKVSQQRVGVSLRRVNPFHHSRRQNTIYRSFNPIPYTAAYFGEKLHIDQNEKLIMYGVTHVCAVDGFSGKIVGFISMPVKSNGIIYNKLYREVVTTYGLWDQIRVDKGKEWYLSLFINKTLSSYRHCTSKPPYLQTTSKKNHTVERLWVEVNRRINYPLKGVLADMTQKGEISLDDPLHQFCCSWLTMQVANVGASLFVAAWNAHPIPGGHKRGMRRGIPNVLMNLDYKAKRIDPRLLPPTDVAMQQYAVATGGSISEPCFFGNDPLEACTMKKTIRFESFCRRFSFEVLFFEVSNGCDLSFRDALKHFIDITYRLSHSS